MVLERCQESYFLEVEGIAPGIKIIVLEGAYLEVRSRWSFRFRFSFFNLFRCHFHRIWRFFFQRLEERFMMGFRELGF
jgi:hypothetical protein